MDFGMFAMWVVVGLVAGWLAGYFMKAGGYGLTQDLTLGLLGSILGSWLFGALGVAPGAGLFAMVIVAFLGAALVLAAQRQFWYART